VMSISKDFASAEMGRRSILSRRKRSDGTFSNSETIVLKLLETSGFVIAHLQR
jgi:hypothetical protein